jgi:hypothetical protein
VSGGSLPECPWLLIHTEASPSHCCMAQPAKQAKPAVEDDEFEEFNVEGMLLR